MMEERWFVRTAAVLVGLANLVVLAHFFGGEPALPMGAVRGEVSPREAIPPVLAAVAAGFAAAEVAIKRFDRMSAFGRYVFFEKLSHRRAGIVGTVCLGGALMGILLGALLVLQGPPDNMGTMTHTEQAAISLLSASVTGAYGAMFGGVLGAIEGLILAPPLAAILGGLDDGSPSSRTTA